MAKYFIEPFAADGDRATIPETVQPDGSVSYPDGYGVDYQLDPSVPPGLNIERTKFNELLYQVTLALQQYQQFGFPDFITSSDNGGVPFPYEINATVRYNGLNYYSLEDNNEDTPPSSKWGLVVYGQQFITGDILPWAFTTIRAGGWLWMNGTTIGSAASGATQRANADTATLYAMLWNEYSNTVLPIQDSSGVATTRGANAAADFAANKRLPLPDYRGRTMFGADNMGGASSAGRITNGESGIGGTTLGASGGLESVALTSNQNGAHTHTASTTSAGTHSHAGNTNTDGAHANTSQMYSNGVWGNNRPGILYTGCGTGDGSVALQGTQNTQVSGAHSHAFTTDTAGSHTHTVTVDSSGLGSTHQNMPPAIIGGGYIIKI